MGDQLFIHEFHIDPVGGDRESVVCNTLVMTIEQFKVLEPTYEGLPEEIKGFKYIPDKTHYYYNFENEVTHIEGDVEPVIPIATLNLFLLKTQEYAASIESRKLNLEMRNWDTGDVIENRKKRILEIKGQAWHALNGNDWYVIRYSELQIPVPQKVQEYRAAVRQAVLNFEEVLQTYEDPGRIKNAQASWPVWDYQPE